MYKKLTSYMKPLLRSLVAIGLVLTLCLSQANSALAARGGRIGGGSFRAPSRTYSPPRSYSPPGGYGGGGYYPGPSFPFFFPYFFVGGGGGGLLTLFVFIAVAGFLVQTFRRVRGGDSVEYDAIDNPKISVAKLQVGLLAEARELQSELNQIAMTADTSSTAGLAEVLQETTLALLRHPSTGFTAVPLLSKLGCKQPRLSSIACCWQSAASSVAKPCPT